MVYPSSILRKDRVELPPAPIGFASLIVTVFPGLFDPPLKKSFFSRTTQALFAEIHGKRFTLLWRGSSDGFLAQNFHDRCDGRANTLTFIEDTEGNIFGVSRWWSWSRAAGGLKLIRVRKVSFSC
jgi:hypothetical protein